MKRIDISGLDDPRLRDYTRLTDVALRRALEPETGMYLAESSKVITRALAAGHAPRSVLLTEEWLDSLLDVLAPYPELPVFVGNETQLEELIGFHLHRGALASMERPVLPSVEDVIRDARRVVILENVVDHSNVGSVFRAVAGLGADAVLVTDDCADPLYRRAIRVSMGAVLQVPWTRIHNWRESTQLLRESSFTIAGLALADSALSLRDFSANAPERVALLLGSEGHGLSQRALKTADVILTIPMHHGVDSLNVANAAGIALWALS